MRAKAPSSILTFILLAVALASCARGGASRSPAEPAGSETELESEDPGQAAEQDPGGAIEPTESEIPSSPAAAEPVAPLEGAVLVVVENHPGARPQKGLHDADVVYESDVIAGITRFLAVYQSKGAPEIGPVRSLRKHFIEIAHAYDAPLAHCGASEDSYALLKALPGLKNLDEMSNGDWFWRNQARQAPHNLFTNTNLLQKAAVKKGFGPAKPNMPSLERSETLDEAAIDATYLKIPFRDIEPGRTIVEYRYQDGSYQREINGQPHLSDGKVISPENVLVLFVKTRIGTSHGEPQLLNEVVGSGAAIFFTGGKAVRGSWKKNAPTEHFTYYVPGSAEVEISSGQTWVELVDQKAAAEYK